MRFGGKPQKKSDHPKGFPSPPFFPPSLLCPLGPSLSPFPSLPAPHHSSLQLSPFLTLFLSLPFTSLPFSHSLPLALPLSSYSPLCLLGPSFLLHIPLPPPHTPFCLSIPFPSLSLPLLSFPLWLCPLLFLHHPLSSPPLQGSRGKDQGRSNSTLVFVIQGVPKLELERGPVHWEKATCSQRIRMLQALNGNLRGA